MKSKPKKAGEEDLVRCAVNYGEECREAQCLHAKAHGRRRDCPEGHCILPGGVWASCVSLKGQKALKKPQCKVSLPKRAPTDNWNSHYDEAGKGAKPQDTCLRCGSPHAPEYKETWRHCHSCGAVLSVSPSYVEYRVPIDVVGGYHVVPVPAGALLILNQRAET